MEAEERAVKKLNAEVLAILLGVCSGGETKEEALTHLHSILLMILLDLEEKKLAIPADKMVPNGAKITINTGAE